MVQGGRVGWYRVTGWSSGIHYLSNRHNDRICESAFNTTHFGHAKRLVRAGSERGVSGYGFGGFVIYFYFYGGGVGIYFYFYGGGWEGGFGE